MTLKSLLSLGGFAALGFALQACQTVAETSSSNITEPLVQSEQWSAPRKVVHYLS